MLFLLRSLKDSCGSSYSSLESRHEGFTLCCFRERCTLHSGLNQAVHIPVLAVTFFLLFPTAPDTCSCSTGTLAGQTLTKLSECCGTCFTNNYHTICTVSELFSISVSVSLPLSLSLFCASYFSSFFSIHPSHGLMKRRLGEQHGLFVCLTFFVLILLRPGAVMFFHCGSLTAWTSACEHLNNKTHFYEFIPEKLLHHGQRYYWNIGRERKKYLFSKKTSSESGHSGTVNGNNWFFVHCKSFLFIEEDCFLFCSAGTSVTRVTAQPTQTIRVWKTVPDWSTAFWRANLIFSIDQSTGS